jgi:hypothetical protein
VSNDRQVAPRGDWDGREREKHDDERGAHVALVHITRFLTDLVDLRVAMAARTSSFCPPR